MPCFQLLQWHMKMKKEVNISNYVIYLRAMWVSLISHPDLICCGTAFWFSVLISIPRAAQFQNCYL